MEDNSKLLYQSLFDKGLYSKTYEDFLVQFGDSAARTQLHEKLLSKGLYSKSFEEFDTQFFPVKKKEISEVSTTPSETSLQEQPPLTSTEQDKERTTSRFGDVLRSLKSGSLRALGGITGLPSFINRTVSGAILRPIVKSMGGTDEEANYVIDNMAMMGGSSGVAMVGGAETQQKLIKKAKQTEEKMYPIEGSIWDNIKKGNLGDAGELLGRGFAQSLPYLAMTASTAGAGSAAVLGTIGATAAAQQYGELEGQKEQKRILNSWLYGGFEAAGELVTAGLVRGVGKTFRTGVVKGVDQSLVKGVAKEVARSFGLEGSSEAATQIGQNFTDIVTGVDTNKNLLTGVMDAFLIGGVSGAGIGVAHPVAAIVGRTIASDKEVSQVQENAKQQEVLIDQLDQTDSDPVKKALKKSIADLQYEADEVMDKNYELAKKLSPAEQDQVAELYSVWNELQKQIDEVKVSEQEKPAIEKTINGIKNQIQTVKDNLVTRLEEQAKAEKEAKVEEIKGVQETELEKLKEKETKELEKVKKVAEGEKVNKKEVEAVKDKYDTKVEEVKSNTEEELAKVEEEYQKSDFDKKWAPTRDIAIEKLTKQIKDAQAKVDVLMSKKQKTSDKTVQVGGFGANRISVNEINKKRSQKTLREANESYDEAVRKLRKIGLEWEEIDAITGNKEAPQEQIPPPIVETEQKPAEITPAQPTGEPIEPLSPKSEGIVPPTVEKGAVVPPVSGETKFRKTQINSLIQDQTRQQQEVAKIVDANKERYNVLHDENAVVSAKKMIDALGVQGATLDLEERTRDMQEFPIRNTARMVLFNLYSKALIDPGSSEVDKSVASAHITKLQQIMSRENTPAGQGISAMRMWKEMQPASLLEYTIRKIDEANQKTLNKKLGETTLGTQLDELYQTLDKESQNIIKDILAGKKITLPKEETKTKPPVTRKYVPQERIKAERDYRKNLLAEYKRTQGQALTASITGITSQQIELGGNLLASYVREGYYKVQEVIDRLKGDFKEVGIGLNDKQIEELLGQGKNKKETYGEYLERKESQSRMREGEKLISKKISDVITEHWTEKDELKRTLAQKLIDEAGLTEQEAKRLEKEILDKFDEEIIKRSQKQLTKIIGTEKLPTTKAKKGIRDKMIELINLGALDEDLYRNLFAEKFNLVELTDMHKEQILKLANNVQMSSGRGWLERDATIKLAKYIYELYPTSKTGEFFDTWIGMAYANMLAGPSTSILNLASAGSNMLLKPIHDLTNLSKYLNLFKGMAKGEVDIYNPFGEMFYVPALRGIQMGSKEAAEVYKNGDLNNKYIEQVAKKNQFNVTQLERDKYGKALRFKPITVKIGGKTYNLGNLLNLYKYAGRNLAAQDKLMLTTSYEIELAHILRDKLRNKNLTMRALTKEVMSIFNAEHIDMDKLNATLADDVALYKKLTGEDMTPLQQKIRKRELILEELPITKEEKEDAERLARSNIFTDDRGGMFGTVAQALGRLANSSPVAGMVVKPFVPFTKVVGNVAEYMMDHTPFYGLMRANGMGVSAIAKKLAKIEGETSQMGERGSRAYYEQMGRAWFGTVAFSFAMMIALGHDEDDFMEITGGYNQEGFKKSGRTNVTPPYTWRIGNVKIPYKNVPSLAIPFSLIGNVNDALKAGQDEGDIEDRFNASLLFDATMNSVFMIKDMSFLDGVQRGSQIAADIVSTDEKKLASIGEGLIKSYLGFATRPLPQNNNAVQQIWKIFDPTSYSQGDIKGMLGYATGLQHFIGRPSLDQFGDVVTSYPGETLMPYTHWLGIKGKDPRWGFLAKYNAIPNKLYNRIMQIEGKDGLEKRKLEPDELFDYIKRTGELFSESVKGYMADKEKVSLRESEIAEREKNNGDIEKISGVREDVEKLWADAKDEAEMELFRWGSVKEEMPKTWDLIKEKRAFQPYQASKSINKQTLDKSQLYEFNNLASVRYAEKIEKYLLSERANADKNRDRDKDGISDFNERINKEWVDAKSYVESRMSRRIKANPK